VEPIKKIQRIIKTIPLNAYSLVIGNWKDPTRLFKNENTALRFVEESGNTQQRDLNGALALVHLRRA
jgi:hypothetical protein